MKHKRWSWILPLVGLAWFSAGSYSAFRFDRQIHAGCPARYFYWGSIRLDSDPLNRRQLSEAPISCKNGKNDCGCWESPVWIDPGWGEKTFIILSLPAFLLTAIVTGALARFGISSVSTFFVSMPFLLCAWFYLIGWWIDGRTAKHRAQAVVKND